MKLCYSHASLQAQAFRGWAPQSLLYKSTLMSGDGCCCGSQRLGRLKVGISNQDFWCMIGPFLGHVVPALTPTQEFGVSLEMRALPWGRTLRSSPASPGSIVQTLPLSQAYAKQSRPLSPQSLTENGQATRVGMDPILCGVISLAHWLRASQHLLTASCRRCRPTLRERNTCQPLKETSAGFVPCGFGIAVCGRCLEQDTIDRSARLFALAAPPSCLLY